MSDTLRQALIETALAMNASGINQGAAGNLSMRSEEGMLLTPSGMAYPDLAPEDIVFMDLDGNSEGLRQPSSEWRFHLDIYRQREDVQAIVHAHPVHCAALACLNRPIPAFHYMVAVAGGRNIRCAQYATFGTQALSDHVIAALADRNACLMANHGLIALGQSLSSALALAVEVENLANMYTRSLSIGDPVILEDEEMDRVIEKFQFKGHYHGGG